MPTTTGGGERGFPSAQPHLHAKLGKLREPIGYNATRDKQAVYCVLRMSGNVNSASNEIPREVPLIVRTARPNHIPEYLSPNWDLYNHH